MNDAHEPTELVYPPASSWAPALAAAGLAATVTGLFAWWPYAVIGGVVLLFSLRAWLRTAWREMIRLPRKQTTSTAPLPLDVEPPAERL